MISRSTIDGIRDGLGGKWDTPAASVIVSKWIENTLPRLRVWIPVAIHSFVWPILLSSEVEDEPGMFQNIAQACEILMVSS